MATDPETTFSLLGLCSIIFYVYLRLCSPSPCAAPVAICLLVLLRAGPSIASHLDSTFINSAPRFSPLGIIAISKGPGVTSRTRHIELRYHYVRQLMSNGEITPTKIGTKDNISDVLTKAVSTEVFNHLVPFLVNNVSF